MVDLTLELMAEFRFDQVNIVLADLGGAARFLRALGAHVPESLPEWTEWEPHDVGFPAVAEGFHADLDSCAFARHWGGLPEGFTGVVVNLRAKDGEAVDAGYDKALGLGAVGLRAPYDAFFGARYAVVQGPGPIAVGIMGPMDQTLRGAGPAVSDFA